MSTQTFEDAIQSNNRAFESAFARGDAAGLAAAYTSGAKALPPNGQSVAGRSAIQQFWQGVINMGVKKVTLETKELEQAGDTAYEVGQAVLYSADAKVIDTAKYIVVWKQDDGQWKWHRDIWNSNNAA